MGPRDKRLSCPLPKPAASTVGESVNSNDCHRDTNSKYTTQPTSISVQGTLSPLFSKLFSKFLVNANFKPQLMRIVQGILSQFGVFSSHCHYHLALILVSGVVSKDNALGQGPHVNFGSHKHPLFYAVSIGASFSCIHVTLSSASEYGRILLLLCPTESPRISAGVLSSVYRVWSFQEKSSSCSSQYSRPSSCSLPVSDLSLWLHSSFHLFSL